MTCLTTQLCELPAAITGQSVKDHCPEYFPGVKAITLHALPYT